METHHLGMFLMAAIVWTRIGCDCPEEVDPAFEPVRRTIRSPRVLLIGDSISIG